MIMKNHNNFRTTHKTRISIVDDKSIQILKDKFKIINKNKETIATRTNLS